LLVDQWEELYTYRPTEPDAAAAHADRTRRFIKMLLEAVRGGVLQVVLTLRADYWGEVLNDAALAARLPDEAIVHLRALDREALEAVGRPAETIGLTVPDTLVEVLLNDASGQPGDLPLLGFALQHLWFERSANALTLRFWPAPLIQLNPSFVAGATVQELVGEDVLHEERGRIFRIGKDRGGPGDDLRLHRHQEEAIRIARAGRSYVLTTGTGSGKSLSCFIPIADRALRRGRGEPRITAIVVYPMNALCNSQLEELKKFLEAGYPEGSSPVTFARPNATVAYTGTPSSAATALAASKRRVLRLTGYP
jgi:hypothetical protein